jgi:SAM-dependent methyltransferase
MSKKSKKSIKLTSKNADKHSLYEQSVQNPEADVEFVQNTYKKVRKKKPLVLREDFCGTAKLCCEWVNKKPQRKAIGIDLDQPTLDWGISNNLDKIGKYKDQISLINQNVLNSIPIKSDIVCSFNFSYCIFKERHVLLDYFKNVKKGLKEDGMFFLDIHGGTETYEELEEEKDYDDFTYSWDQMPYDPINGHALRHIHFKFQDGSKLNKAFTYDWRLWSIPEIMDVMKEAKFKQVDVYWEGADEDGEGDGDFKKTKSTENETSWIAYVVGLV